MEAVPETQLFNHIGGGDAVKVLGATKVMKIQKKAGVTFKEDVVTSIERLVVLEEVAVNLKASREGLMVRQ